MPGTAVGQVGSFPLRFVDEGGCTRTLDSVEAVETHVEYVDDNDPPYRCCDAGRRRVRLIVWALELLICQVVSVDYAAAALQIREVRPSRGGEPWLVEHVNGVALRTLDLGTGAVQPIKWDSPMDLSLLFGSRWPDSNLPDESGVEGGDVLRFHDRWMKARLGRRFG